MKPSTKRNLIDALAIGLVALFIVLSLTMMQGCASDPLRGDECHDPGNCDRYEYTVPESQSKGVEQDVRNTDTATPFQTGKEVRPPQGCINERKAAEAEGREAQC